MVETWAKFESPATTHQRSHKIGTLWLHFLKWLRFMYVFHWLAKLRLTSLLISGQFTLLLQCVHSPISCLLLGCATSFTLEERRLWSECVLTSWGSCGNLHSRMKSTVGVLLRYVIISGAFTRYSSVGWMILFWALTTDFQRGLNCCISYSEFLLI